MIRPIKMSIEVGTNPTGRKIVSGMDMIYLATLGGID